MNKQDLIAGLEFSLKSGTVSKEEILNILNSNSQSVQSQNINNLSIKNIFGIDGKLTASGILYIIGGIILLTGIVTLVYRFWSDLSSIVRILLTLGMSFVFYFSSSLVTSYGESTRGMHLIMKIISIILLPIGLFVVANSFDIPEIVRTSIFVFISLLTYLAGIMIKKSEIEAKIMQVISGCIIPVSIFITLDYVGIKSFGPGIYSTIFISLSILYILSLLAINSIVFSIYSIGFSTLFMYSVTSYMVSLSPNMQLIDIMEYLTLALSICYLLLSSYIKNTSHGSISRFLDLLGIIAFYTTVLILGGYSPGQSIFWEIIGIASLCLGLYISKITQNDIYLKITSIFIFIFIGKFTGEYFVNSFGWPISLIFGGLVLIGAGFFLVRFGKKIKQ